MVNTIFNNLTLNYTEVLEVSPEDQANKIPLKNNSGYLKSDLRELNNFNTIETDKEISSAYNSILNSYTKLLITAQSIHGMYNNESCDSRSINELLNDIYFIGDSFAELSHSTTVVKAAEAAKKTMKSSIVVLDEKLDIDPLFNIE